MRDQDDDYRLMVEWRNRPHVHEWWEPDVPRWDIDLVRKEYRSDTNPGAATVAAFIERAGHPVGFIQFYRWASYADEAREVGIPFDERTWGIDIFIGDRDETGRGLGPKALDVLCRHLENVEGASAIALTVDVTNDVALRCYRKAGFEQVRKVLDLDTRNGERVLSWLMVRRPTPNG